MNRKGVKGIEEFLFLTSEICTPFGVQFPEVYHQQLFVMYEPDKFPVENSLHPCTYNEKAHYFSEIRILLTSSHSTLAKTNVLRVRLATTLFL